MILHGLCDAEHMQVKHIGDFESPLCLAERKMRTFAQRRNGGFSSAKAREFQNR